MQKKTAGSHGRGHRHRRAVARGSAGRASPEGAPPTAGGSSDAPPSGAAPPGGEQGEGPSATNDACTIGDAVCVAKDRRRACVATAAGPAGAAAWNEETCAAGSGCFQGACVRGKCSDECTLGAAKSGKTCAPYDVATGVAAAASDPTKKTHDRARVPRVARHDTSCADQVRHDDAVDVGDRVASDFLWQRQPWRLFDAGNASQTHPGVDYLVAYFLGRHHGFVDDDTAGTCLVWQ